MKPLTGTFCRFLVAVPAEIVTRGISNEGEIEYGSLVIARTNKVLHSLVPETYKLSILLIHGRRNTTFTCFLYYFIEM